MPLSLDTILAQAANSGSFNAASGTATLGVGTTAGNTVVLVVASRNIFNTPSGFVAGDSPATQSSTAVRTYLYRRSSVPAGETSWTISPSTSGLVEWVAFEMVDLDPDAPLDVELAATVSTTTGTTASSGTTPASTTYDGLVLAVHAAYRSASITAPTWSGHTNSMTVLAAQGGDDGTNSIGLSVSAKTVQQLATWETTATSSITLTATNGASSFIVVYSATGAKREPNIAHFWGFKVGADAAGLSTGNAGSRYLETVVGSPAMVADGLQLSASAAAEHVSTADIATTSQTVKAALGRIRLRFDSALPGADLELAALKPTANPTDLATLSYRTSSQKLGVKVGSGTEVLSDATVAADTWVDVDMRLVGTTTAYTCDWQVNYGAGWVAQTQATATASAQLGTWQGRLGWTAASTGTVTYAYALYSVVAGHYPLGDWTMVLLKVDPAATPSVLTTVGNFALITNNATGAALTTPTLGLARDAVDEWPPVVGASADGVCVTTASATDYIEWPLETYQAAPAGSVRAARVVMPVWAASATACTCKVAGWDGTTSTTLFAEADPTTDNSSTPAWICKMWRPVGGWTQAKVDAAGVRYGSNDATPDNGPLAVGMEIAVQVAQTQVLFGGLASAQADPTSAGILGVTANAPAGQDTTLHYEEGGSPTDVAVVGGTSHTETIDAPDAPAVNYVAAYPAAEGVPDA